MAVGSAVASGATVAVGSAVAVGLTVSAGVSVPFITTSAWLIFRSSPSYCTDLLPTLLTESTRSDVLKPSFVLYPFESWNEPFSPVSDLNVSFITAPSVLTAVSALTVIDAAFT